MGREILFRGKQINTGEWLKGYVFDDGICGSNRMFVGGLVITDYKGTADDEWEVGISFSEVRPDTVSQYTGLKDKNGKMIFEGDICRNIRTGEFVSVKWHGTMAGFVWSKRKEKSHLYDWGELFRAYDKYEVIGNIHDNPELLEVSHD